MSNNLYCWNQPIIKGKYDLYLDGKIVANEIVTKTGTVGGNSVSKPIIMSYVQENIKDLLGDTKFVVTFDDNDNFVIHTDRIDDDTMKKVERIIKRYVPKTEVSYKTFNHNIELDWEDFNKYSNCVTQDDIKNINPDFKNDLTESGGWYYDLQKYNVKTSTANQYFFQNSPVKEFVSEIPETISLHTFLRLCAELENVEIKAPKVNDIRGMLARCDKLVRFSGNLDNAEMGSNCVAYSTKFSSFECDLPKLTDGLGMFDDCILDKESVLRICDSIPKYEDGSEHTLTLGIHIDFEEDSDVDDAIEKAKQKGWTIIRQNNGTKTTGLMTLDLEEIWCKVVHSELGSYVDSDGNYCDISWGHDVKSPNETTPSELGYKSFYSMEDAINYFNLKSIF